MPSLGPRLGLVAEAATGGFYVAITRSFFIIMLSYANYNLSTISTIFLLQAVFSVLFAALIYKRGLSLTHRGLRFLTLVTHALERVLWISLPFLIYFKPLEIAISCAAMFITTPVGIFLNYLIYVSFTGKDVVDVVSKRFAIGSATSIIGLLLSMALIWALHGSLKTYIYLYSLAGAVGLLGSVSLLFSEFHPRVGPPVQAPSLEVEVGKVTSLLFYILFCTSINLVYMIWIPYIKTEMHATQILATMLVIAGSIGTIVGSLVWRSNKLCRISMILLIVTIGLALTARQPLAQPLIYLLFSTSTMGGFILITAIYSTYVTELGTLRVSALSQVGYETGTVLAALLSMIVKSYNIMFIIADIIAGTTLALALITMPEVAIVPKSLALNYARTIYNISTTSLTYTTLFTKETAKLFLQILTATLLITIIYAIYQILTILVTI
ncbi:MAG: hypothetical protein GXO23_07495 [Crenarchaeota archaeon]|nr:hypothetical protein [Thermoproteota archaeon]